MRLLTTTTRMAGAWALASFLLCACGESETTPGHDVGASNGADAAAATDAGGGGLDGHVVPSDHDGQVAAPGDAGRPDGNTTPRPSTQRLFVSHYASNTVRAFDTATMTQHGGSYNAGSLVADIAVLRDHGILAIALGNASQLIALDADTMAPVAGSPYATGNRPTAIAHDPHRELLYVHCIGTLGDPTRSELSVFDTSSRPWQELSGSPFEIDVTASHIEVDPSTGVLVGHSLFGLWAVGLSPTGPVHVTGSPATVSEGPVSDLAIDASRRRVYFGIRGTASETHIAVYDLDDFGPITESPVTFEGNGIGSLALDPSTGDLFFTDTRAHMLRSMSADLTVRECDSGCSIPETEAGLVLDSNLHHLYIAHVPSVEYADRDPGSLSKWDVSDPTMPVELTTGGSRPRIDRGPDVLVLY